jgi:hypothetical protein
MKTKFVLILLLIYNLISCNSNEIEDKVNLALNSYQEDIMKLPFKAKASYTEVVEGEAGEIYRYIEHKGYLVSLGYDYMIRFGVYRFYPILTKMPKQDDLWLNKFTNILVDKTSSYTKSRNVIHSVDLIHNTLRYFEESFLFSEYKDLIEGGYNITLQDSISMKEGVSLIQIVDSLNFNCNIYTSANYSKVDSIKVNNVYHYDQLNRQFIREGDVSFYFENINGNLYLISGILNNVENQRLSIKLTDPIISKSLRKELIEQNNFPIIYDETWSNYPATDSLIAMKKLLDYYGSYDLINRPNLDDLTLYSYLIFIDGTQTDSVQVMKDYYNNKFLLENNNPHLKLMK